MAVRKIYTLPKYEKLLRKKSKPVKKVNRQVRELVQDLLDTLETQAGVGLAAPQIGILARVCLVMVGTDDERDEAGGEGKTEIIPLINPEILEEGELERGYDGCLSIPGLQGYTRRPKTLHVRAIDMDGDTVEYLFEGFDARVAAHEIDHLDGILYFDRLDTLEDLYYMVEDEEEEGKIAFLAYLDVHPELRLTPDKREELPTRGVKTIMD
ncbi:MAG: peptide deformylase [Chloroflexota bacterium]|nr:peptide deformylase [Chloroflexota bacterium]